MAAGLGTRMKSQRAKVLHELGGAPLIAYVVRAAQELNPRSIITIVGHQAEEVRPVLDAAKLVGAIETPASPAGREDGGRSVFARHHPHGPSRGRE